MTREKGSKSAGDRQKGTGKTKCPACGGNAGDNYFDRCLCFCAPDGVMHTRCRNCGCALDKCGKTDEEEKRADARG